MATKKEKCMAFCRYYAQRLEYYTAHKERELLYYLLLTEANLARFYFSNSTANITKATIELDLDESIKLTIDLPKCQAIATIDNEIGYIKVMSKNVSQLILEIANTWWFLFSSRLTESEYNKVLRDGFVDLTKLSLFSV